MNNKEFIRKYRNIFWAPTTKLGNPLYKRTENNNDKELLKIEQEDTEFSNKIKSIWSSPSNIRAIFIGVNKAFIIYHKGISEGEKKVGEINSNLIESNVNDEPKKVEEKVETEEMFREEEVDYQVGDYVYHETFGAGRVVEVSNTLVSVAFKHPHGIKKLMKNHKKLSKV